MIKGLMAVGLMASVMSYTPKMYIDNANDTITITAWELNNNSYDVLKDNIQNPTEYENFYEYLPDTGIKYKNTYYRNASIEENDSDEENPYNYLIYFNVNDNYKIITFNADNEGKWKYTVTNPSPETDYPFTEDIEIGDPDWFYRDLMFKKASTDGIAEEITTDIKSGLTLIRNLATAFLAGFTGIFWNTTTSSLTVFGSFALIMLSVAIVFAIIKLVLNIARSNTGV